MATEHARRTVTISSFWNSLSLAQKYLVSSGFVVAIGTLIIGVWVSQQIENGVTRNAAVTTALYADSFIGPMTQELDSSNTLSVGPIRALDEIFREGLLADRLVSVKIWRTDGTIVYSPDYDLIGKKFEPTEELVKAAGGEVSASFDDLDDEEDARERETNLPILEIYSPIRAPWSGKVIAVAEFYENGTELKKSLAVARLQSWLVVAAVMAGIAGLLMTFVLRASRTIDRQQETLRHRLAEVTESSEQNQLLRQRLQQASERVTELNERFLKRTSAELHDGPAQLLGFASLRLGEARKMANKSERDEELGTIERALSDAMLDIRNVCKGLSLPEIEQLSLQQTIERVCRNFTERTQREVEVDLAVDAVEAPTPIKICVFRFVQEALNNSFKHAPESRSTVQFGFDGDFGIIVVSVIDDGKGFDPLSLENATDGLGLGGLQERIRSIGGELTIDSSLTEGTRLTMQVSVENRGKQ
ncbi:MAG: sensor histidine kinase [Rhizobiaceae bacterium]